MQLKSNGEVFDGITEEDGYPTIAMVEIANAREYTYWYKYSVANPTTAIDTLRMYLSRELEPSQRVIRILIYEQTMIL